MDDLPAPLRARLFDQDVRSRQPAWMCLDDDGRVLDAGGSLHAYDLPVPRPGADAVNILAELHGLLPLASDETLESVQLAHDCHVDLRLLRADDRNWVLLLDATRQTRQRRRLQQDRNELALLRDRLQRQHRRLAVAHAEIRRAHAHTRADLAAAARMQQALLPDVPPDVPGFRFAWDLRPCADLAGDALDIHRLDDEHIGLYLLDVSGHGFPAALLSFMLTRVLSPAGSAARDPHAPGVPVPPALVADRLNRRFPLATVCPGHGYFTLCHQLLHVPTRRLRYVCAGHAPPWRLTGSDRAMPLPGSGFPIGWVEDPDYEEQAITLAPGDRVITLSDGVLEAADEHGVPFGSERLAGVMQEHRHLPLADMVAALMARVETWTGGRRRDDQSALALEVTHPA